MHTPRPLLRRAFDAFFSLLLALCAIPSALAQDVYPSKPIRLIVPFGAGGISDAIARLVSVPLGEELKQSVIVENRPGAGGNVATQFVAKSPPDGYTLVIGVLPTQVVNPLIYSQIGYDPWTELTPVSLLAGVPFMLSMGSIAGVTDLKSLVEYAKANPGKLNYGTAGAGGHPHLGMELFKMVTQTDIVHIPFKSGGEAVQATIAGQIQLVLDAVPVVDPHIKSGKLKALAVVTETRVSALPELKTGIEQGLAGFSMKPAWFGIVAPANTPRDRIATLNAALAKVFQRPAVTGRLAEMSVELMPLGADAYAKHLREERDAWTPVIRAAKIKLD